MTHTHTHTHTSCLEKCQDNRAPASPRSKDERSVTPETRGRGKMGLGKQTCIEGAGEAQGDRGHSFRRGFGCLARLAHRRVVASMFAPCLIRVSISSTESLSWQALWNGVLPFELPVLMIRARCVMPSSRTADSASVSRKASMSSIEKSRLLAHIDRSLVAEDIA